MSRIEPPYSVWTMAGSVAAAHGLGEGGDLGCSLAFVAQGCQDGHAFAVHGFRMDEEVEELGRLGGGEVFLCGEMEQERGHG